MYTLLGTNMSHLWKRKIIFQGTVKVDMLVLWRVDVLVPLLKSITLRSSSSTSNQDTVKTCENFSRSLYPFRTEMNNENQEKTLGTLELSQLFRTIGQATRMFQMFFLQMVSTRSKTSRKCPEVSLLWLYWFLKPIHPNSQSERASEYRSWQLDFPNIKHHPPCPQIKIGCVTVSNPSEE